MTKSVAAQANRVTVLINTVPVLAPDPQTFHPDRSPASIDAGMVSGGAVTSAVSAELSDPEDMFPDDVHIIVSGAQSWKVAEFTAALKAISSSSVPETPITFSFDEDKKLPKVITSAEPEVIVVSPPANAQARRRWVAQNAKTHSSVLLSDDICRHIVSVADMNDPHVANQVFVSLTGLTGTRVTEVSDLPEWLHAAPEKPPTPFTLCKLLAQAGPRAEIIKQASHPDLASEPYRTIAALQSYWKGMATGHSFLDGRAGGAPVSGSHRRNLGEANVAGGYAILSQGLVDLQINSPKASNIALSRTEFGTYVIFSVVAELMMLDKRSAK